MHYYQHHIGDFMKDTANLTDSQLATYLRMIWAYYDSEKPIAGDIEDIAFAMRSDEKTVRLLLRHYFTECPDGWHHARCDAEIAKYREKQDKAAKSASARWINANAMRTHSERNANESVLDANQEPITNNQEKPKKPTPPSVSLPDWIPPDVWQGYVEMRQKIRAPLTQRGIALTVSQLTKLKDEGHDPVACLNESIQKSWRGVFAPKQQKVSQQDEAKAWIAKLRQTKGNVYEHD